MFLRKRFAPAIKPPRNVLREGWWLLRTIDPSNPLGPVEDPLTGDQYPSLDAATPQGWEEAFRGEYLPGARRAKGIRAYVSVFPHEVILVDPERCDVVIDGYAPVTPNARSAQTCIPTWVIPVAEK